LHDKAFAIDMIGPQELGTSRFSQAGVETFLFLNGNQ